MIDVAIDDGWAAQYRMQTQCVSGYGSQSWRKEVGRLCAGCSCLRQDISKYNDWLENKVVGRMRANSGWLVDLLRLVHKT